MDYIGLKCAICKESFKEGDDVVVCPDCGTPMHRSCYKTTNACPNVDKHTEGFVFADFGKIKDAAQNKPRNENSPKLTLKKTDNAQGEGESASAKGCPICGNVNRSGANFCDNCGTRLSGSIRDMITGENGVDFSEPQQFAAFTLGQSSDIPASTPYEEDITAGDVACFVAVNTPYYLEAFKRIKKGLSKFNFSAAIFSGVWFLYRKLYKVGTLLLSIEALLYALKVYFVQTLSMGVMEKLLTSIGVSMKNMGSLTMEQYVALSHEMQQLPMNEQILMMVPTMIVLAQIAVMIVSGALANKLYYKQCIERIREVKEACEEEALSRSETSQSLYLSGGVNAMLAGVFGFVYLFLLFM